MYTETMFQCIIVKFFGSRLWVIGNTGFAVISLLSVITEEYKLSNALSVLSLRMNSFARIKTVIAICFSTVLV